MYKAGGIIIKDKRILVEKSRNREFFIAPGGSIEKGEKPEQALVRELLEEFKIKVKVSDLEKFGTFRHPAAGQDGKMVCMEVFLVKAFSGEIIPDNEVEEVRWITSNVPKEIKVGSIFEHEVIPRLKEEGLID
ncbi:hypothetical protein A2714_01580 [Candidatus Woesebacteria bacterium RIFCSPHIGHO2_01_FULL_38_9]|uniref:Nudix hydrolase domain-containing protein n=2 Tax=Candidatus Woeseibacteriota TaxID=1752722 RepID=A0A1F7Y158_9BACT|nr:MAG: hypothetical protein A2714_01580 [Candidatus Woesebacteria bacterium RIFCSPHIGHO2_01_FULL_38_9]OGM58794.1 MAG: hypothetical protein A3A75_00695 [Candidatus Woesebacteria bacterium RIFCSPLOWO2_01_FULL_39_10]